MKGRNDNIYQTGIIYVKWPCHIVIGGGDINTTKRDGLCRGATNATEWWNVFICLLCYKHDTEINALVKVNHKTTLTKLLKLSVIHAIQIQVFCIEMSFMTIISAQKRARLENRTRRFQSSTPPSNRS